MLNTACFTRSEVGLIFCFLLAFFTKSIIIYFSVFKEVFAMKQLKLLQKLDKEECKWSKPSDCIS